MTFSSPRFAVHRDLLRALRIGLCTTEFFPISLGDRFGKTLNFGIVLDRFAASLFFNFIAPYGLSTVVRTDRECRQTNAVFPSKPAGNGVTREI